MIACQSRKHTLLPTFLVVVLPLCHLFNFTVFELQPRLSSRKTLFLCVQSI